MWGGTGWEEREEPERAEDGQARPGGRERCQGLATAGGCRGRRRVHATSRVALELSYSTYGI